VITIAVKGLNCEPNKPLFSDAALAQVARQPQQQQQPLTIIYPSSSVSYIDYWPDGVELSLLCATSPQWSTLAVRWFKDNVPLVSSDRWRYSNLSHYSCASSLPGYGNVVVEAASSHL